MIENIRTAAIMRVLRVIFSPHSTKVHPVLSSTRTSKSCPTNIAPLFARQSVQNCRLASCSFALTEKVFRGGTDDARGFFRSGLVAVTADEHCGSPFGLAHQESGGRRQLIRHSKNRCSKQLSFPVACASQIQEHRQAGCSDGHIGRPWRLGLTNVAIGASGLPHWSAPSATGGQ